MLQRSKRSKLLLKFLLMLIELLSVLKSSIKKILRLSFSSFLSSLLYFLPIHHPFLIPFPFFFPLFPFPFSLPHRSSDPFLSIYKTHGKKSLIARTEVIEKNINPRWEELLLDLTTCGGVDAKLKIEVFDFDGDGTHDYIGEVDLVAKDLSREVFFFFFYFILLFCFNLFIYLFISSHQTKPNQTTRAHNSQLSTSRKREESLTPTPVLFLLLLFRRFLSLCSLLNLLGMKFILVPLRLRKWMGMFFFVFLFLFLFLLLLLLFLFQISLSQSPPLLSLIVCLEKQTLSLSST